MNTLFKLIVILLVALVAWGILGQAVIMVGAESIHEFANPYYIMCNDPLMTNVTLVLPDCGNGSAERSKDTEDVPAVVPTATPLVVDTPTVEITPPTTDTPMPEDNTPPTDDTKQKCNKGEGNGAEGCDPGNHPERGNDDENDTTPREDHGSLLNFAGFITIIFRIGRGRKEYRAEVSSFNYQDGNLWLYQWPDEKRGIIGNCGYVPNGKVISAHTTISNSPYMPDRTLEVIRLW